MQYNQCWLNYNPIKNYEDKSFFKKIIVLQDREKELGEITNNAVKELVKALKGILGLRLQYSIEDTENVDEKHACIVLGLSSHEAFKNAALQNELQDEGFLIQQKNQQIYIIGKTEKGILYGVFELIRRIASGESVKGAMIVENPSNPLRMLNHWDNLDGSIERGYSGNSFFFKNNKVLVNKRTLDYARLISSVGINAVVINNVNVRGEAASSLITDRYLGRLKEMADIFSGYGIKLFVSANFAAPIEIGGLLSADPLDEGVSQWWNKCVQNIYQQIPDFGGFLIKADSEGRPGPFTYNRTHADGANVLARALAPFCGTLIWRCFVYNCKQDWRDYKTDRAKAAYDNFIGLDGDFDENVILQIKNGPMDFQVREPVSPLFGGLKKTNQMLEVQIAQEYTGQQKHICYLIPMWKEVLNYNTYAKSENALVSDIISGKTYKQVNCGMAGVTNTGDDYNWTGHDLAAANLYGFGRLSWNMDLSPEKIAREWIAQTFSNDDKLVQTILDILLNSWHTYEKYTSPLGIGWMVNPNHHYGPNVDGYEYDKWGTYHRADHNGLGVDRTTEGTGYTMQYNEPNASMYENIETCPEELLLFFHYIPYNYILKSGKTLIQHIYDTHFEGVEEVGKMLYNWDSMEQIIPEDIYQRVLERMNIQLESSIEWRDRINTYFYRKSGIDDKKRRKIFY